MRALVSSIQDHSSPVIDNYFYSASKNRDWDLNERPLTATDGTTTSFMDFPIFLEANIPNTGIFHKRAQWKPRLLNSTEIVTLIAMITAPIVAVFGAARVF